MLKTFVWNLLGVFYVTQGIKYKESINLLHFAMTHFVVCISVS